MDLFQAIERRHSVRQYERRALARPLLEAALRAADQAPSAGNRQAYEIVVAERDDTRSALAAAAHGQGSISTAPVVLVFFANPRRNVAQYGGRGESLYCVQDATIAAAYAQLAAATQGLGSCWVGAFDEAAVREVLRAPERLRPVVMLPIGHAAEEPHRTSRRGIDHLVWHEHF